jgi:hypothetical protein
MLYLLGVGTAILIKFDQCFQRNDCSNNAKLREVLHSIIQDRLCEVATISAILPQSTS